jgi:hypothetical protein
VVRRVQSGRTVEAAARSSIVAATSRDVLSGAYLDSRGRPGQASRGARDGELALRAWEVTAEMLGMDADPLAGARARKRRTAEERYTAPRLVPAGAAA